MVLVILIIEIVGFLSLLILYSLLNVYILMKFPIFRDVFSGTVIEWYKGGYSLGVLIHLLIYDINFVVFYRDIRTLCLETFSLTLSAYEDNAE